jgi:peroxiredoxin Q/BCP
VRNHHASIAKALIFGVSVDSPKSHAKFITKHSLPFPLLSDESREVVEAYGVWVESMYGKKYMGTERLTFVIQADGTIDAIHRKISRRLMLIPCSKTYEPRGKVASAQDTV